LQVILNTYPKYISFSGLDLMATMKHWNCSAVTVALLAGMSFAGVATTQVFAAETAQAVQSAAVRPVGTVQSISGNSIVVKTDAGATVTISVQEGARILRAAPGQSQAGQSQTGQSQTEKIELQDIQTGDRVVARGAPAADGATFNATALMVMKQTDVASRQQQDQRAWQRGTGGIVSAVDTASGEIKIKSTPKQTVTVHTSPKTGFLRYSADSVQFKDATKSYIDQIKPGDQLRARGIRSADGAEITADEVIAGTFRNVAGTISKVDAAQNTLTVQDLMTKKPVQLKITSDSQMHQLPAPMAMRIAMMLKGREGQANSESAKTTSAAAPRGRAAGAPDFQQMLSRTPSVALSDLKKGDAVMIVATPGGSDTPGAAITLISGVEPILTASPNGSGAATLLSNWNMSEPAGGEGGGPQ
jgi:hypothetical protein